MKSIGVVAALLALVVLGVDRTTGAYWSAADAIPGTELQMGRLDLKVEGLDAVSGYADLDVSALVPGMSKASILTVSNAGNVALDYTVSVTGTNADGRSLVGALIKTVTDADTTDGTTCAGSPLVGSATLAPGDSDAICVQVLLPATAPASVAGAATDLTIAVDSTVRGAWTDKVDVSGTGLSTAALTAPTLSCAPAGVGTIALSWTAVPGATAYEVRVDSGLLGEVIELVPAGAQLSKTVSGLAGTASVKADFGSSAWVSPSSVPQTFSALAGVLGRCS